MTDVNDIFEVVGKDGICIPPIKTRGICQHCRSIDGFWDRKMTQYHEDYLNYGCLCEKCWGDDNNYWGERWADHYGGLMS